MRTIVLFVLAAVVLAGAPAWKAGQKPAGAQPQAQPQGKAPKATRPPAGGAAPATGPAKDGVWKVVSATHRASRLDTKTNYGSNVEVTFVLSFTPGTGAFANKWVAPPTLDWHEKFIMIETNGEKKERWVHENNMYMQKPHSLTLKAWPERYILAFDAANGKLPEIWSSAGFKLRSGSILKDKTGRRVTAAALGPATTPGAKATAVKNYLMKNGGSLEITIHDIPSIIKPKVGAQEKWKKERLLIFDVGFVRVPSPRVKLEQYLVVDSMFPSQRWTETHLAGHNKKDLPLPAGYKNVATPVGVTGTEKPVIWSEGEER